MGAVTESAYWLRVALVVLVGVQTGRFVDQWFILALAFRRLDAPRLSEAVRSLGAATKLSMLANAAAVAVLFAAVLLTEPDRHSPRGTLTLVAFGLFLAVVGLTVVHEMPLIARIEQMPTAPPPAGWPALRNRWLAGHTVRTLLDLGLFVAVVMALR